MSEPLTNAKVEKLRVPRGKSRLDVVDGGQRGLRLRITDKGVRTWSVTYRPKARPDKKTRFTIGPYPEYRVKDARTEAQAILGRVARGEDPQGEKVAERKATRRDASTIPDNTFDAVADDFIARHVSKLRPRTRDEYVRPIEKWLKPRWGYRPLGEITKVDIVDLLDDIADGTIKAPPPPEGEMGRRAPRPSRARGGNIAARRCYAVVRKLFNWALGRGIIDISPATIPNDALPGAERVRTRILKDDELIHVDQDGQPAGLWPAFDAAGYPFGTAFKLLLLTGERRNEVTQMRWSEIDLEARLWTLPAERTKSKREHKVPLSDQVMDILEGVPRFLGNADAPEGDFVFSTRNGEVPISGISKATAEVAQRADLDEHWTLHDLRRTAATGMGELGFHLETIGAALNHATQGITGRVYVQRDPIKEKRAALDAWGWHIHALINPDAGATDEKVVQLNKALP